MSPDSVLVMTPYAEPEGPAVQDSGLQEGRTELVRHINSNFVAVPEHKGWPDLRAPDEEKIGNEVGRPAEGWSLMPVPTSG